MKFQTRVIHQAFDENKTHIGDFDFVAGKWRFTSDPNYALDYDQLDEVMSKIENLTNEQVEVESKSVKDN